MRVSIQREDYDGIVDHARKGLPNESCGLIAGTQEDDGVTIRKVYYLTNVDAARDHFTMDPKEQLAAIKDMRTEGYKPLGNWHSHPESPSRPSIEDKRLAYDPNAVYMILSLMEEEPVLNAFHIEGDAVRREELSILGME